MTEEEIYRKAKKRVKKKKGFYVHFAVYGAAIFFFFVVNMLTYADADGLLWFLFPALGWGIGLASHYASIFGLPWAKIGDDWEEEELDKEMRRLERRHGVEPRHDENITIPDDELELKEFKKLRNEWDDQDFV